MLPHVASFYRVYTLSKKLKNKKLTKLGNKILRKAGVHKHYINFASYDEGIDVRSNTIAFSLGFNIILPVGAVFLEKGLIELEKEWIEFIIAHELAHIVLNHYPLNVLLIEGVKFLPPHLHILILLYRQAVLSGFIDSTRKKSPFEGITTEKELDADEWAVKVLVSKKPAIEFLKWLKDDRNLKISHLSMLGTPALTINERIKNIKKIKMR